MNIDLTVAIPSYNGAGRLPKLFEGLLMQNNVENLSWEIIIVDNNSTDNTAQVVREFQADWRGDFPLIYCFELKQGASFARQRAVREARAELVAFLDDDNLPYANWVAAAYLFGCEHPKAGAYGGKIHGLFEVSPPENFGRIASFLALRERGNIPHLYEPDRLILPPGASLVIRKKAWLDCVPTEPILSGRTREFVIQGEDYEPLLYIAKAGWEIWYAPAMQTAHQIPQWRLERDYLLSLMRGCGLCISYLRTIGLKRWQKPLILTKIMLGGLKRVICHWLKYQGQLQTDLVAACEMEFFLSVFLSPFYYLNPIGTSPKRI